MAEPVFVPIRNKRQSAVGAVQGLLSIVAGLGITNALRELFIRTSQVADWTPSLAAHQQKVNPIRQLIAILPWQSCPIPPWCTLPDLGTWYFPIIITIVQIIVVLRFYQSSTLFIEDPARHPHFSLHAIVFIFEGILVASNSFYIHYPIDFFMGSNLKILKTLGTPQLIPQSGHERALPGSRPLEISVQDSCKSLQT